MHKHLGQMFVLLAAISVFLPISNSLAQESAVKRDFDLGVTGSSPNEAKRNSSAILSDPAIKALVLKIADEPMPEAAVLQAVAASSFSIEDMIHTGLLALRDGKYYLAFNYLSADDQRKIYAASEGQGRKLADLVMARADRLRALAAKIAGNDYAVEEVLYLIVGCFGLDWDGLRYTSEMHYRPGPTVVAENYAYTPWMKENAVDISRKGLFWGSHNATAGDFRFTSFGDHDALPRAAQPDILFRTYSAFADQNGDPATLRAVGRVYSAYGLNMLDDARAVLLALDGKMATKQELTEQTGLDSPKLSSLLALLTELDYVVKAGEDSYTDRAVILTAKDKAALDGLLVLTREAMVQWHEAEFEHLKQDLGDLTLMRHGVPYGVVYTEVWHYVFGIANRTLVERGLFADPYAAERRHKGFIPMLWATSLDPDDVN